MGLGRPGHAPCLLVPSEWDHVHFVRLQKVYDLFVFLLEGNELLLFLTNAIELAAELAHEAFNHLRGDVFLLEDALFTCLLEGVQHDLGCVGLSEDARRDFVSTPLGGCRVRGTIGAEEEFGVARCCCPQESVTIRGCFSHRLAETERVSSPVVDDDGKMMGGNTFDP